MWILLQLSERPRRATRTDSGQTTAEYALVLLAAASIALLLIGWAAHSGRIGALFDAVFNHVIDQVG